MRSGGSVIRNGFGVDNIDRVHTALGAGDFGRVSIGYLDQLETGDSEAIATASPVCGEEDLPTAREIHIAEFDIVAGIAGAGGILVNGLEIGAAEDMLFGGV